MLSRRVDLGDWNIPPRKILPEKFPSEGSTPVVSPPEHSPPWILAWLCEICRWREPVPTRVLNPNANEASYKPKQRIYRKTWGGGNFQRGVYLEPILQRVIISREDNSSVEQIEYWTELFTITLRNRNWKQCIVVYPLILDPWFRVRTETTVEIVLLRDCEHEQILWTP